MILKKIRKDKKGVSPVIGVILMVAATIVIAAVVIAMLGGFTAPGQSYAVSATAEVRSPGGTNTVYVTYMGGPDADQVDSLSAEVTDSAGSYANAVPLNATAWNAATPGAVATEATGAYTVAANDDLVIVTATFLDGTKQIILNTWV